MNESGYLTVNQVAKYLQLNPQTVSRMCQFGEIPAIKFGRTWRISRVKLEAWLDEQEKKVVVPAGVLA